MGCPAEFILVTIAGFGARRLRLTVETAAKRQSKPFNWKCGAPTSGHPAYDRGWDVTTSHRHQWERLVTPTTVIPGAAQGLSNISTQLNDLQRRRHGYETVSVGRHRVSRRRQTNRISIGPLRPSAQQIGQARRTAGGGELERRRTPEDGNADEAWLSFIGVVSVIQLTFLVQQTYCRITNRINR